MARTLAIHLGDFKTGTTAIQDWPQNWPPNCPPNWPHDRPQTGSPTGPPTGPQDRHGTAGPASSVGGIALLPGAPHLAAARAASAAGEAGEALWAGIGQAAEAAEAPVALVSSEHFEFADPAALAALLARALPGWAGRIRLLAYVRPHGSAFLARYAESTKIGSFEGPPEAYLDWPQTLRRMTYAPRFGRWRAAFGAAFELRLYDPGTFPEKDVRRDLALALTGADPGPLPPPRAANPAPGIGDLALARALHRAMTGAMTEAVAMTGIGAGLAEGAEGARWTLGRAIGREMAAEAGGGAPLALDRPLARALEARFAADAQALDDAFFPGARPLGAALGAACRDAPEATPRPDPETLPPDLARAARIWGRMLAFGLARDPAAADRLWHEQGPQHGSQHGSQQAASLSPASATAYEGPPERQDDTPR